MTTWLDVLKEINLNEGDYCVLGGAVQLLGIRKSNDCDLLVTRHVFNKLVTSHNLLVSRSFLGSVTCEYKGIEIFTDDGFGRSAEEWIESAQNVDGIMVGSIDDLLRWKEKIMVKKGRNPAKLESDMFDIKALKALKALGADS